MESQNGPLQASPIDDLRFRLPQYPRSAKYSPAWILENSMGSHALWLTEALAQVMALEPGLRLLEMGCGKGLSAIFLAREFGVQVWATDYQVKASDNWRRIREAGVPHLVYPIDAEAHALPYADGFFDAVVSVNSLQYYATDESYFRLHLARLLKPGGQLGFVVPGLLQEFGRDAPAHLKDCWDPVFYTWHSADWWRWHLEKTGLFEVELAEPLPNGDGVKLWLDWEILADEYGVEHCNLLRLDAGRNICFVYLVARKRSR